jgi:hypothetical protein
MLMPRLPFVSLFFTITCLYCGKKEAGITATKPKDPWFYAYAGNYIGVLSTYSYSSGNQTKTDNPGNTSVLSLSKYKSGDSMGLVLDNDARLPVYTLPIKSCGEYYPFACKTSYFCIKVVDKDTILSYGVYCGAGNLLMKSFTGKKQ